MQNRERALEELLVLRAQGGDRRAIDALIRLRAPKLFAHAMRILRNRSDAEDVVQDAWIDILRGLRKLQTPRAFRAWSTRIVTRKAAKLIAKATRRREGDQVVSAEAVLSQDSEGPLVADGAVLRREIAALPPDQAATIALFYLEEMRVPEVAFALDIPEGTVKSRLSEARKKLKRALKGEDDE